MTAGSLILNTARAAARGVVDLLMPPVCLACKTPVAAPQSFCADCYAALKPIEAARCVQCATPLPLEWRTESHCFACLKDPPNFDRTAAPYVYDGPARQLVLAFKHGRETLAAPMAAAMARAAGDWLRSGSVLCAVPLHRWRLADRGYNQSLLLARAVSRRSGVPFELELVRRIRHTPRSRGMTADQRRRNVAGAFRLAPDARARIAGREVILVDDVMTSGATASNIARLLRQAGAARVSVLVYARVAATDAAPYVAEIRKSG